MLRFIVANISDLIEAGIEIDDERKSLDGLKAIKHIEHLSDEQFEATRYDEKFEYLSSPALDALLQTADWTTVEI